MDEKQGLTSEEVKKRTEAGQVNTLPPKASKTIPQIIRDNVFTLFNGLNALIAVFVFFTGSYRNMLFMCIVLANLVIGIVQEVRSKYVVDRLAVITAPQVRVLRDGEEKSVSVEELVLGDITVLSLGNQICADSEVVSGMAEVDESLLTGEADAVVKRAGDRLLSGSFVVSGECTARTVHVGTDNFAYKLTVEAAKHKKLKSELMLSLNKIIKFSSVIIVPMGILLFLKQYFLVNHDLDSSIIKTAAAMIGMIPEGLVLLTSIALAAGVIKLAAKKTLTQELYSLEMLARVDTLCLDKTGTLTEGAMQVGKIEWIDSSLEDYVASAIHSLPRDNPTILAMQDGTQCGSLKAVDIAPFSSARKWSGVVFEQKSVVIGAPERVAVSEETKACAAQFAKQGYRVIVAAVSDAAIEELSMPENRTEAAIILLEDKIRKEANETLAYFKAQGVDVKIISGDNVDTVSAVAERAGVENAYRAIDMSETQEEISDICEKYTVFARVSPEQKKQLVLAMKEKGHTVAMTGDGVNDVLALKEADCSIAMGSGSDAARQVAQLVLMESNFAVLPSVVAEGRRVINNITRTSSMFLVKTVFSFLLSLITLIAPAMYPFVPIQMTLISSVTVGIPSFFLALEPNNERVQGDFLRTVFSRAIPGALTIVLGVCAVIILSEMFSLTHYEISAACVYIAGGVSLLVLYSVCRPLNPARMGLIILMTAAFVVLSILFKGLFMIGLDTESLYIIIPVLVVAYPLMRLLGIAVEKLFDYAEKKNL